MKQPQGKQKMLEVNNKKYGSLTFVAIVSDNPSFQPRLPQVIIGNERILRVQDLKKVDNCLPANVYVFRRKSGWVNAPLFAQILTLLRNAVSSMDPDMEIVLLADLSPVHTHELVLKTAKRLRIRLCFVPATCTWLLQPCDTHLFRKFKAALARLFRMYLVTHGVQQVPLPELLGMIIKIIRSVIQGTKWAGVFEHNGFGQQQKNVSKRVLCNLSSDVRQRVEHEFPDAEKIQNMLPSKRRVNHDMLRIFTLESMPQPCVSQAASSSTNVLARAAAASGIPWDADEGDSAVMTQDSEYVPDSGWAHRLRPRTATRPSTVAAFSSSQSSALPVRTQAAASRAQPCLSLMTSAQRHPQAQRAAQDTRPRQPWARPQALAMPRRRTGGVARSGETPPH